MADNNQQDTMTLIEEAEKRRLLSPEDMKFVREARARNLFKSSRDEDLIRLQQSILDTDKNALTDDEARGMANAYVRLRFGERDDLDGRKRYGRQLTGRDYLGEIQAELDPTTFKSQVPNTLADYRASSREQKLAKADEWVTGDKRPVGHSRQSFGDTGIDPTLPPGLSASQAAQLRQVVSGISLGGPSFDAAPLKKVSELTPQQQDELIQLGEQEAFKKSYVPVRQWLESRIGRNPTVQAIAKDASRTGKIDQDGAWQILTPEERSMVSSYVFHTRPFDASEGAVGTMNEAGRKFLSATWWIGKGALSGLSNLGTAASTQLWATVDPVSALDFEDAIESERRAAKAAGESFRFKAPERSFLGESIVGAAETTPFMMAVAYGGPAGAVAAGTSVGKRFRDDMLDKGATPEQANFGGVLAGLTAIYVERLGGLAAGTKFGKQLAKPAITKAATKTLFEAITSPQNMARFTELWARGATAEIAEEFIESIANGITEQALLTGEVELIQLLDTAIKETAQGAGPVAIMTLFGAARGVSSVSENAGDMTRNNATLNVMREQILQNASANQQELLEGAEAVNQAIIDTWRDNPKQEARRLLMDMGISKDALTEAEPELNRLVKLQKEFDNLASSDERDITKQEKALEQFEAILESAGFTSEEVSNIVDAVRDGTVGRVNKITREISTLDALTNQEKLEVLRHEAAHVLAEDMGVLTEQQAAMLDNALPNLLAELQKAGLSTDTLYADMAKDEKMREAVADAVAVLNPQERTAFQKVADFFTRLWNAVQGKGFNSVRSILKDIEKKGFKQAIATKDQAIEARSEPIDLQRQDQPRFALRDLDRTGHAEGYSNLPESVRAEIEQFGLRYDGVQEFNGKVFGHMFTFKEPGFETTIMSNPDASNLRDRVNGALERFGKSTRFARRTGRPIKDIQSAGEQYALARVSGRNARAVAQRLSDQTGFDVEDIISVGQKLVEESDAQLEAGATRLEQRVGVRKAAATRSRMKELRNARKEGARVATRADKAEAAAKKESKSEQRRIENTPINQVLPDTIEVDNNTVANVREAVNKFIEGKDISKAGRSHLIKRALNHVLSVPVRKLRFDRSRSAIQADLARLRMPNTGIDTATNMAQDIINRLESIKELSTKKDLIKEIGKVLGTRANKRVASTTILSNRTIDPVTAAEFAVAKRLLKRSKKSLDDINGRIEAVLQEMDSNQVDSIMAAISKIAPAINDRAFSGLTPIQKMQVFADISSVYGSINNKSNQELAEIVEKINHDAAVGRESMAKLAEKQASIIKTTTDNMKKGSRSISGKKSGPTGLIINGFWNIRQRFENLTRFNDSDGKAAGMSAYEAFEFQASNDRNDTLVREWSEAMGDILINAYGKAGSLVAIERLTELRKSLSKYQPPNDSLKKGDPMSIGQIMQIITTWDQVEYRENLIGMGYTDAIIENMRTELTDGDKAFITGVKQLYSEMGLVLDETANSMFGVGVANFNENYAPVVTDVTRIWTAGDVHMTPLTPPSLNQRIPNTRAIDTRANIVQVLDSKIRENAHFAAWAESSALARSVFADKDLVKQLESVHGGNWNALSDHLTDIYGDRRLDAFKSKVMQRIQSAMTLRALSGNLKLPLTQITSLPAYMARLGVLNSLRIGFKAAQNPQQYAEGFLAIWNSDQFKNRKRFGTSEFVAQAMRDSFGESVLDVIPEGKARSAAKAISKAIRTMYKLGMVTNSIGDAIPIMLFGPAIYADNLRMNDGNPAKAMSDTWEVIQTTQQSFATKDRNVLSRRAGILGKIVNAFASTPGQYLAMETAALQAWTADPGIVKPETARLLSAVFVVHVLLSGSFFTVSQLFNNFMDDDKWDDEDKLGLTAAMLSGPVDAIPLAGSMTSSFIEAAVDGKASYVGGLIPLSQFKRDAAALGAMLHHGMSGDFDEMLKNTDKVIDMLSAPSRQVRRAVESR